MPDVEGLTKQAAQRLEAIQDMEELGSGFYLAMHDLEIRGAGEVLGENQSGNMMEVGFQLYNEMLAEAVRSLKAGQEPDLPEPVQRHHRDQPARAGAAAQRLLRRRAHAPEPVQAARQQPRRTSTSTPCSRRSPTASASCRRKARRSFDVHRLRVLAKPYGVSKIDAGPALTVISFRPNPPVEAIRIIELVQKNRHVKLAGNDKLRIERATPDPKERAQLIREVLRALGPPKAAAEPAGLAARV